MENRTRRGLLRNAAAVATAFTGPSVFLLKASAESNKKKHAERDSNAHSSVSPRIYYASNIPGVSLDCDLNTGTKIGGGVATDNTAALNAVLATGSPTTPVLLIIDGAAVITGLQLPVLGHVSIVGLGWDTGFYIKSGSNADVIHNGGPTAGIPSDPASTGVKLPDASTRGAHVRFADFRINGNRGDGKSGNSTTGKKRGSDANPAVWYFGINLMNLNRIEIEHVQFYDISAYGMRLSNCGYVSIFACEVYAPKNGVNTDAVHLDGGCNDITISDCIFNNLNDDCIALNAPEGYSGDITDVLVTNCIFDNCRSLMRIYSAYPGTTVNVRNVAVTNCRATVITNGFILGLADAGPDIGGNEDSILDVTISNCTIASPWHFCDVSNNIGILKISNCTWIAPADAKAFINIAAAVSSLTISGCSIYRTESAKNTTAYLSTGNGSVGTMSINGFALEDQIGHPSPAIPYLTTQTGTVSRLIINAIDMGNFKSFAESVSMFTSVSGPGVLSTNAEFPDTAVANGTLYFSATTHLPSIKVRGVVKALTLS